VTVTAWPIDADAGSPSYAASIGRHADGLFAAGTSAAGRHMRSGVRRTDGTDMQVSVAGDDVTILSGVCLIDGPASFQGAYAVVSDATVTLTDTVAAPHATLTRIDSVYVRIYDDIYDSSGQRAGAVLYQVGTASGSPTPPDLSSILGSSVAWLRLADLSVAPASLGGFVTVNDKRPWLAAQGVIRCATVSDLANPVTPSLAWESTGGRVKLYNGSAWQTIYDPNFAWVNLSYESGWTTEASTGVQAAYREEPGNWVSIRGRVRRTSGTLSASFGPMVILPAGVRPGAIYGVAVTTEYHATVMDARIEIKPTGSVEGWVPANEPKNWIELAGRWTKAGL